MGGVFLEEKERKREHQLPLSYYSNKEKFKLSNIMGEEYNDMD